MKEFLRLYRYGLGNVQYTEPPGTSGGGTLTAANNGDSLNGTIVVFGNDVGANLAQLLSNRELPMNGFSILFSHIGQGGGAAGANLIFQADAAKNVDNPFFLFNDSTGAAVGAINFFGAPNASVIVGKGTGTSLTIAAIANTLIGSNTGALLTTPIRLVSVGFNNFNTAVTPGQGNIAIGVFVFQQALTGTDNIGVGRQTLGQMTTGSNSIAIGFNALTNNSTGSDNVAIGQNALGDTIAATNNASQRVAIGSGAGQQQNIGAGSVLIGYRVCFGGAAGIGTNNTAVGFQIFSTGGLSGNDNVILGANIVAAGGGSALGNANIWIGANGTQGSTSTLTNLTVIGQGITISGVGAGNNVAIIGRADQNIIFGITNLLSTTDNGSKTQFNGSIAKPIQSTAVNLTLDATMVVVILTAGGLVITQPAAASATRRVYRIVNQAAASTFAINYINFSGAAVNTIAANSVIEIQSDGTNWQRIL